MPECWNSEAVITWQWEGRCISVDMNSQQYEAIAVIQCSKHYVTVGRMVVSIVATLGVIYRRLVVAVFQHFLDKIVVVVGMYQVKSQLLEHTQ